MLHLTDLAATQAGMHVYVVSAKARTAQWDTIGQDLSGALGKGWPWGMFASADLAFC